MLVDHQERLEKKSPRRTVGKLIKREFKPQVLTKQISDALTEAILEGSIAPGTQLLEMDLQQQLGVSRSPLREAFRELERKGLVVILPRRGAFVREVTARDVRENFFVRATLEGLAARLACGRLSKQEVGRMRSALEGMKQASPTKDHEAYRRNHQDFHEIFIEASDNLLLIDNLKNLRMHRLWYYVSYRVQKLEFQPAIDEQHERILRLFEREDVDPHEVELYVRGHIENAVDMLFGDMDLPESEASVRK